MDMELFTRGGPVLWFILGVGILAAVVFLERALNLHRMRVDVSDLLHGIFNNLRRGNADESLAICEETPGPVARLLAAAIRHRDASREELTDVLDTEGRAEISRMERRLSLIALAAQTAPVLGLLGTVMGLLQLALDIREAAPMVDLYTVADGLIPAIVTTAAGLLVAVPCYVGFNVLVVKIDRLVLDMEQAAMETIRFFEKSTADISAKKA